MTNPSLQPRLTLQTLGRGDGLLGLMAFAPSGARGPSVTVAQLDWPTAPPSPVEQAAATHTLRAIGLHPIPPDAWQWRSADMAPPGGPFWTLAQEDHFGDFWADQVPLLQAQGYRVIALYLEDKDNRKDLDLWWLHVEKTEVHTPDSLHERNQALYRFAEEHGLDAYDGMDVGAID